MPGERFVYEFPLNQHGTFFYHSHMAMQEMVGMLGGFIIHPVTAYLPRVDKDYLIALQEYAVLPNSTIPDSMKMEFNWLTFNGKAGPAATPLIVRQGERVRIRIINLGMDHHPIHLHGFTFWETGREGARQPDRRAQDPVRRRRRREQSGDGDPTGPEARQRGPGRRDRGDLLLERAAGCP